MANIFKKDFWRFGSTSSDVKIGTGLQTRSNSVFSTNSDIAILEQVLGYSLNGIVVNDKTAMSIPAVLACVEIRNNNMASVPLRVYTSTKTGPKLDDGHPLDYALNIRPNAHQTPVTFRKTLGVHRDFFGVGIAVVERGEYRNTTGFRVLHPREYTVYETMEVVSGKRKRTYIESDGTSHEEEDLIIWGSISLDGYFFRGITGCIKEVIKTGLTTRQFVNSYYQNGTFLGGILTSENNMTKEVASQNRDSWQTAHGGSDKAGKVAVLSGGLKFQPISNTLVDSQLVEFLQLDKFEIYQAFGVPPHLVGDTTKQTSFGSGLESQTTGFYTLTLRPAVVHLEQEISYKCLKTSEQRKGKYVKHNFNALLRADMKTRYDSYAVGLQNGWLSPNDIRGLEELPHYEGGGNYMVNGNMIPVAQVGQQYNKQDNGRATQTDTGV